ncbi:AMP-binding protein [Plantactinospora siamensis]|uniref:AMP-binding protein n=1 Tax=Plantactinospora siamensis TaxID=555372 RepID=A0ABV6NT07_9ACTN
MWDTLVRPSAETAAYFRENGWWRDGSFLDDLDRAVRENPDQTAIISYGTHRPKRTISYRQLDETVDRFAAALVELGVGRDDVVAVHLPNWWMLTPLYLACARVGAVNAPIVPSLGARELGQVLAGSRAKVCVVPDTYSGADYIQRLDDVAPESLARRVVVRADPASAVRAQSPAGRDLIDFDEFFVDTAWERTHRVRDIPAPDADDAALLLFTSGTTGAPKAVAHSYNTLYAGTLALAHRYHLDAQSVVAVPHYLTHMAGLTFAAYMSLVLGGTCVMQDDSDMGLLLDCVAEHGVTFGYAAPMFVLGMLAEQRSRPRDLSSLRHLISGSAPIPPQLIADTREVLGVELGALWGMTENGGVTVTSPDDPPGWAANSDGSVVPGMELRIDAESGSEIGKLLVRGAAQCLGYLNQREIYQRSLDADGWFDTGDMARPDGRDGIRITGRRVDLITRRWANKVPTLEVEAVILRHPGVREVVLTGYPDTEVPGADCLCAVIVPEGAPPTVDELNKYLDEVGMTWENWPDRVEVTDALPRNSLGKVLRSVVRERVEHLVGGQD